jgi:hypothetical protein
MCHDFDEYLMKARIAEAMRTKKPVADDLQKQRGVTGPAVPREPEKHGKDQEPVPV